MFRPSTAIIPLALLCACSAGSTAASTTPEPDTAAATTEAAGEASSEVTPDGSVAARLKERGVKYEIDEDGDYKITYSYKAEKRTQLVYVSGGTQDIGGFKVREVFAPAGYLDRDRIDGAKALELLADARSNKMGSWEVGGNVLYYVAKLHDNLDAAQLESAMDIVAETADDMELELSGDRDDL